MNSAYRVPVDGSFRLARADTAPPKNAPGNGDAKKLLAAQIDRLDALQRRLYADRRYAVLLVFQGMDTAGKDSTIRAVLTGINPAGCQVHAFGRPSAEELAHDFLWRCATRLPARGHIGVFNRSYYEEVLTVRVHPELLTAQQLPDQPADLQPLWASRYASIRNLESHLAASGTVILKFWLHLSRAEQQKRLLARLDDADKNWKFDAADLDERRHWDAYQRAAEDALNATSTVAAPWYVIPADSKPFMRLSIAELIAQRLGALDLREPRQFDAAARSALRERLQRDDP